MILQRLVEFDARQSDSVPSGYRVLEVHWLIRGYADGSFRDVLPLASYEGKRQAGRKLAVPDLKRSGTTPPPALFCDLGKYVLGKGDPDSGRAYGEYRTRYLALVNEFAAHTDDPIARAAVKLVASLDPERPELAEIGPNDRIQIEIAGTKVTDLPSVRTFWSNHVRRATASRNAQGVQATCLVTGQTCEPVRIFSQKIVGVPNTNQLRGDLVSFNEDAFRSYGLAQSQNAPISPDASEAIIRSLNLMLASDKHCCRIGGVAYLAWTTAPEPIDRFWNLIQAPDPEHVRQLLTRPITAKPVPKILKSDFFVLALSGANSRIVVRDYHETTLETVQRNIAEWFRRLDLVGLDGQPNHPFGIGALANSLFREAKDVPAHVPTALLAAAVFGRPIPDAILGLAVKRNTAMQGPFRVSNGKTYLSLERLALIKAILETKENRNLSALDPNHPDPAYHCGRLLSVLEQIQRAALGKDINATVVDRYYGAACASPGSILGNLVNDAQAHLAKLRKERGDGWAQNLLMEVLAKIGPEFPKTLSLPRQGLFALGYYHQRAESRDAAIKAKAAREDSTENQPA